MVQWTKGLKTFGIGIIVVVIAVYIPFIEFEWFTLEVLGVQGYRALQIGLLIVAVGLLLKPLELIIEEAAS